MLATQITRCSSYNSFMFKFVFLIGLFLLSTPVYADVGPQTPLENHSSIAPSGSPLAAVATPALDIANNNQVATLQKLLAVLVEQLAFLSVQKTSNPISESVIVSVPIAPLFPGAKDSTTNGDVSRLQRFLTGTGDYTYGEITGYYGPATRTAVERFQVRSGIVSFGNPETTGFGVVGPKTLALMRTRSNISTASPITPRTSSTSSTQGGTSLSVHIEGRVGDNPSTIPNNVAEVFTISPPPDEPKKTVDDALPSSAAITQHEVIEPETTSVCVLKNGDTARELSLFIARRCAQILTPAQVTVSLGNNTSITIPSGIKIVFEVGSRWNLGSGTKIVLEGTYEIPLVRNHVFFNIPRGSSFIANTRNQQTSCSEPSHVVYPEWFGATAGDKVDDSFAINQAAQFGDDIRLDKNTYSIKERIVLERGQRLSGAGKNVTRLVEDTNPAVLQWDEQGLWRRYGMSDFAVGLVSDCSSLASLTVDMSTIS
ncbi:MAG: hypothetical protein RLZZ342_184, partial [Candidatus Parcubacteria bacterium]